MGTKLVIKGAYYFNQDCIIMPHYTGEFFIVDCDEYITEEEIKERYDNNFIEEHKNNYIEYQDIKYYYAEYNTFNTADFELLSDLSKLEYLEEEYIF